MSTESTLVVLITPDDLKSSPPDMKVAEVVVDQDIEAFNTYFEGLGNDPLVKSERAIIKTYLHWKMKGDRDGAATGS